MNVRDRVLLLSLLLSAICFPQANPSSGRPEYRIYKERVGYGIVSVVVPLRMTDSQVRNLLWFFRQNVRTGHFQAIGLTKPTNKRFGVMGYTAGMIEVFRGEKCANEDFVESAGPCGQGEHDDAYYQWGVDGDPQKDDAGIRNKNGDMLPVFDYKDNWQARK